MLLKHFLQAITSFKEVKCTAVPTDYCCLIAAAAAATNAVLTSYLMDRNCEQPSGKKHPHQTENVRM